MRRSLAWLLLAAWALSACAAKRALPPPLETYTLGMWRASYRDYARSPVSLCTAEPRWLQDELSAVNGVLTRWLEATAAGPDGVWTPEALSLLEEGAQTLPPLLGTHQRNLEDLQRCRFAKERAFPVVRERGLELVAQAQERVEQAPLLRAAQAAREARDLWRKEQHLRQLEARGRCAGRRSGKGAPELYYAWESEQGQQTWLFCDGARMAQAKGAPEPDFEPPPGMTAKEVRRLQPKLYLKAAQAFPPERMDRPPPVPTLPGGGQDQPPGAPGAEEPDPDA